MFNGYSPINRLFFCTLVDCFFRYGFCFCISSPTDVSLSPPFGFFIGFSTTQSLPQNIQYSYLGTDLDQFQDTTDTLPCHIYLPVILWIMDLHSRAPKKNRSHGNEVLQQDTTHLIQRPCYQWGSPCQDPAGNRTTRRPPNRRKETQTAVVCLCLPFIRSGQNHLTRHSERGKKTRQTEEEVRR